MNIFARAALMSLPVITAGFVWTVTTSHEYQDHPEPWNWILLGLIAVNVLAAKGCTSKWEESQKIGKFFTLFMCAAEIAAYFFLHS